MERSRESILAIIKALMSKTVQNGATPEEAAAAAQKATELLSRYNIDLREAQASGANPEVPIDCKKFAFAWNSYYDVYRRNLLRMVVKHNFCRIVWSDNKTVANIIGQAHNEEVVEYLFTYLAKQIFDMASAAFDRYKRDRGLRYEDVTKKMAAEWKMAFCDGATEVIDVRLKLMAEDAAPNIKALVLSVDADLAEAQKRFFPYLSYSPEHSYSQDSGAYGAGREAGSRIGLHRGVANTGSGFVRQLGSGRR